jgi:predicted dienelactone hydrolase
MRPILALLVPLSMIAAACGDDVGNNDAGEVTPTSTVNVSADDVSTTTEPPTSTPTTSTTTGPPELSEIGLLGRGEYTVGVATVVVVDEERDRPLTVEIWFPLAEGAQGDPYQYSFVTGDSFESPLALDADASALSAEGPFPLVVYSHGSGGVRFIHSNYTETIASHGYVVIAPDHTGNTAVERITETSDDSAVIAVNRPLDVSAILDDFLDPANEVTAPYQPAIDAENIALTGHSFGGFTAYATVAGFESEVGDVRGDDRIDAIIPLAPAVGSGDENGLLSDEALARVGVPALVIVGTDDKTTPVDPNVNRAWEQSSSEPHYRLELVAGEHQSFTDLCDYIVGFEDPDRPEVTPIVRETIEAVAVEGCSPGDMAIERVQALTNTFAVTFLDSVFRDAVMFTPDAFAIPDDVIYQAK